MLWQYNPARHPVHMMSCSFEVPVSLLGGAPDTINMKPSLELLLSCVPQTQSQDISENSSGAFSHVTCQLLIWIYCHFSSDFRSQKLGVQYFGGLLLPHREVWLLLNHILGEYLPNIWGIASKVRSHAGYWEWNSSAGPQEPAAALICCCRSTLQRKQAQLQCFCASSKRYLMFRRLKRRLLDWKLMGFAFQAPRKS